MSEWVELYRAENTIQAHCIKGMLEVENIPCQLSGNELIGAIGELPVSALEVTINIAPHHLTKAQQLIDQFESAQHQRADWVCDKCCETNSATFELCWKCGYDPDLTT